MSFNDVKDLSEHLKLLGYPKPFPLQALSCHSGTLASFHVVADVLQWLAGLLEPGTVLPGSIDTEDDRILLIRSATEFFVTKSAVKLNPRKLYAAASVTAIELQKITRLLVTPAEIESEDKDDEDNYRSLTQIDIGDKMDDLRRARDLSSDLTERGAALYDLLSKEMVNRDTRLAQANRPMELGSVERSLKNAIAAAQIKLQSTRAQLESAKVEHTAINSKLQRKKAELERTKQRLDALQKIKPAHMQEFQECEKELEGLFQQYFKRVHVRDALRAQLDARTKRITPISSPILQKPAETSMPFIPDGLIDDDEDGIDDDGTQLGGIQGTNYGFDTDLLDIRDEDEMRNVKRQTENSSATTSNKIGRPSSATMRMRPTTGRSRRSANVSDTRLERGRTSILSRSRPELSDDNSSFGSSDSDLDIGGIVGFNNTDAAGGTSTADILSNHLNHNPAMDDDDDDDFDINSMITGELRPKTASKPDHHSDEDF